MKHPQREEWIPYLFGEADPEAKKQLAAHLNACPGCAEELAAWRKSLQRLDAWKVPQFQRRRFVPALSPVLNLAAAAVVVLGLGFGLGRWFSVPSDAGRLRAGLESSLKGSLIPEVSHKVRQELAGEFQTQLAQLREETSRALAKVKTEAADTSAADTAQALQELIAIIRSARAEDQQAVAEWVDTLRKEHDSDFVSLRKDLETVATLTDEGIRAARMKLLELTAVTPSSADNNP
jgi:anti-sigma factor RsiW